MPRLARTKSPTIPHKLGWPHWASSRINASFQCHLATLAAKLWFTVRVLQYIPNLPLVPVAALQRLCSSSHPPNHPSASLTSELPVKANPRASLCGPLSVFWPYPQHIRLMNSQASVPERVLECLLSVKTAFGSPLPSSTHFPLRLLLRNSAGLCVEQTRVLWTCPPSTTPKKSRDRPTVPPHRPFCSSPCRRILGALSERVCL